MNASKFYVTDDGLIFHFTGSRYQPLGRIACLAGEPSALAREAYAWWQARLASDEPLDAVLMGNPRRR